MQGSRRIAVEARRPALVIWVAFSTILALDQVSKAIIRAALRPGESIPLLRDVFYISHVRNIGAAFGLLPGARPIFVATSLLVVIAILGYWVLWKPKTTWLLISTALVAGGAVGNLIDRVFSGRVTDFFEVQGFPVFNIADSSIFIGVTLLIIWILFGPEPQGSYEAEQTFSSPYGDAAGTSGADTLRRDEQ